MFGESISKTYFIGYDTRTEYEGVPIISLVTDPDNLFGMEKGIYGNGQKYESYLENGGMVDGKIQESFIDKQGNTQYIYMASNAFEEGREWEREAQISYFNTDQVYQFERNVATQDASPCILFINGEYWGFYFLTERYTEEYFQKYYGISEDNILMIDSGGVAIGEEEDYEEYLDLINYLSGTDFTDKRNYDELLKKVDMSSFIDFYCINLYIDNQDIDFGRNMALWKSKRKGMVLEQQNMKMRDGAG